MWSGHSPTSRLFRTPSCFHQIFPTTAFPTFHLRPPTLSSSRVSPHSSSLYSGQGPRSFVLFLRSSLLLCHHLFYLLAPPNAPIALPTDNKTHITHISSTPTCYVSKRLSILFSITKASTFFKLCWQSLSILVALNSLIFITSFSPLPLFFPPPLLH